jgi:hypothetical protein
MSCMAHFFLSTNDFRTRQLFPIASQTTTNPNPRSKKSRSRNMTQMLRDIDCISADKTWAYCRTRSKRGEENTSESGTRGCYRRARGRYAANTHATFELKLDVRCGSAHRLQHDDSSLVDRLLLQALASCGSKDVHHIGASQLIDITLQAKRFKPREIAAIGLPGGLALCCPHLG